MPIYTSPNTVLAADEPFTLDHPIVGWSSIVTVDNASASSEASGYPVTNLANPATHRRWQADAIGEQYIDITIGVADDIDYVAIGRHNLGSSGIPVSIEYLVVNSPPDSPPLYAELTTPRILPGDHPALFRFTAAPFSTIRLRMQAGTAAPRIAVLYVGKLLVLPRKVYQGLVPITYGRRTVATNGKSESGEFTGRIVTQEFVEAKLPLSLIDPSYYRSHIDSFLEAGQTTPFFVGWRPQTYPDEIGYCMLTNDPEPTNESPHGLTSIELEMTGIV